jgi:GNAT superfamily N-acetyltransferase
VDFAWCVFLDGKVWIERIVLKATPRVALIPVCWRFVSTRGSMQIRVMTQQDILGGVRLNSIIGWNQTAADWERFLAASPNGCFVMADTDKIVGTSATISYEDKFAWIGMVLVDPDHRNRGIGTTLLQRAVEYLDGAGIPTLKLDATPAGKPLYEKMGFVTEYEIDRWVLKRSVSVKPMTQGKSASEEALSEALDFDRQAFGADRSKLLHSYNAQAPDLTLVAQNDGKLSGYAFGRRGLFADHMGAWMARDDETARTLLSQFLQRSSRDTIIVDALKSSSVAGELLRGSGFAPVRLLTRMYRGPNSNPGQPESLCAILGPEFG